MLATTKRHNLNNVSSNAQKNRKKYRMELKGKKITKIWPTITYISRKWKNSNIYEYVPLYVIIFFKQSVDWKPKIVRFQYYTSKVSKKPFLSFYYNWFVHWMKCHLFAINENKTCVRIELWRLRKTPTKTISFIYLLFFDFVFTCY